MTWTDLLDRWLESRYSMKGLPCSRARCESWDMKSTRYSKLLALSLLCVPVHAGAGSQGVGSQEGEDLSEALDEIRVEAGLPGVVAMAIHGGEVLFWGASGVRAQGSETPITINDPMHMGSCAKAMTSTMVAHLIEQGVLSWETTIAEALPEMAKTIDEGYHGITIEALLKHQAGIAERRRTEISSHHGALAEMEGSPTEVRKQILQLVLATPPSPSAAGSFDYSNFGYMTAGLMVEQLTQKTWGELMREQLFEPLKMTSAGIGSPGGTDVPVGHLLEVDTLRPLDPGPGGALPDAMGPAGLVHCSLRDWGRFIDAHLTGARGKDGFLKSKTVKRLHRDHGGSGYAAGWVLGQHQWSGGQAKMLWHNGSDNTWMSYVAMIPEHRLTLLIATNCASPQADPAIQLLRTLLLDASGFGDY